MRNTNMAKKEKDQRPIEQILWDAANKLRGKVEPAEYKHVVLSLIFLKYANDRFDEHRKQMIADGQQAFLEMMPFYQKDNVFYIPECARWDFIMKNAKQSDVDKDNLALLCGHVTVWSLFGGTATTDSRMIKERPFLLYYLMNPETKQHDAETMKSMIRELLVVYVHYMETVTATDGGLYKDWFKKKSSIADWASFLRYYNVFSIWQKKEWTRTRIQNMRKILDVMFIDPK